jgi:tetratricopeptide (TPR) repeat protein
MAKHDFRMTDLNRISRVRLHGDAPEERRTPIRRAHGVTMIRDSSSIMGASWARRFGDRPSLILQRKGIEVVNPPLLGKGSRSCVLRLAFLGLRRSLVGLILLFAAGPVTASPFDDQLKSIRVSPATQPETAILALLKAGLEEGKPAQAIAETTKWLSQNQPKDAMLLYHAGRSAELSGDWKDALALYQQYLKGADLKSATADEAVYAVHVFLLDRLKDLNGAYAFARTDGGRLLVCPRARQFDAWFLDEAIKRNDVTAVAMRLHACIAAGYPAELLDARYSRYFLWLLGAVDGYCAHPDLIFTQDLYDAVKDLCEVITHNEEMKLRLDWAVSVKAYNVAKIGDETKQKVIPRRIGKKNSDAKEAAAQAVEEKLNLARMPARPSPSRQRSWRNSPATCCG